MSLLKRFVRLWSNFSNLRCASTSVAILLLLYMLIYLIWSRPASFVTQHESEKRADPAKAPLRKAILKTVGSFHKKDVQVMPDGEGVWIQDRDINVMSAFYDLHFNHTNAARFMMPSFIRHSAERKFVCCFSSQADPHGYLEAPAELEFIDLRFMADIQNGAFECNLKQDQVKDYNLISFAPESCHSDVSNPLKIIYPLRRSFEFAICTKVAYGRLDPQKLVEWFEFMKEIGASKVVTFYTNLHPDSKAVFDHYVSQGFLILIPFKPRVRNGVQPLIYVEETAQTRQARHEKTLTVRDCQFRLAGYDFILTIDFDEMPVPLRPHSSLQSLFEVLREELKDASAYRMDPILLPPEWNVVKRPSNWLYHWRFHSGTYIDRYCIKWIYIPSRVKVASTHKIYPKEGFKNYMVPHDYLHFLHFRSCKERWHDLECGNLTNSIKDEFSLKRFVGPVLREIRKLPLEELIPDKIFVQSIKKDHSSIQRNNN